MSKNGRIIIGLGVTGFSIARYFTARQIPFIMVDTQAQPTRLAEFQQLYPTVPVHLGPLNTDILCNCEQIALSPGVPLSTPELQTALQHGVEIVGDIELFAREVTAPVIAITGSNGKSTVTSLVGEIAQQAALSVAVGGNLGTAALDLLLDQPKAELFVLELSSFQLETTTALHPKAATILNISADHCDRYPSMAEYIAAKQRIYCDAKTTVYNLEDTATAPAVINSEARVAFTLNQPTAAQWGLITVDNQVWLAKGTEHLLPIDKIQLQGRHNLANALAACALSEAVGISWQAMQQALQQFSGLPHRCQFVGESSGVRWINDSKGTNVGATIAALEGLGSPTQANIVLIAGGDGKDADFSPLLNFKDCLRAVILLGKDAAKLKAVFSPYLPCYLVQDLASAVRMAGENAKSGDIVLLSPACSSLDMFRNYAHRGELFSELALQWIDQHAKENA